MLSRNEYQLLLDQFPDPGMDRGRVVAPDILKARALAFQNLKKNAEAMSAVDRSLELRRDWRGQADRLVARTRRWLGDDAETERASFLMGETPIELMRAVVDGMGTRGFGRIVNITSAAVKAPIAELGLSNGARAGLTGFVGGAARQVAGTGVTINNLLPGRFATDRLRSNFAANAKRRGVSEAEVERAAIAAVPAGRLGDPDEFGQYCAFLCSRQAGYITGQNLLIDGGGYPGAL